MITKSIPKVISVLFTLCFFLNSCSKEENSQNTDKIATAKDIYVCGSDLNGVANIWKNGKAITLDDGLDPSLNTVSHANQMCINGNDIYVVGFRVNNTSSNAGTIWKNGVPIYIESNGKYSHANVITVVNNEVYIGGDISGVATIWKNGVPNSNIMTPPAPTFSTVEAISVSNNIIYASISTSKTSGGSLPNYDYRTKIVKDGLVYDFTKGSSYEDIKSLYTTKSDVYVAGYAQINGFYKATLWKNGVATTLSDEKGVISMNAICVINNDCYVGGYTTIFDNSTPNPVKIGNNVTIWKNGLPTYLINDNDLGSVAKVCDLKAVGNDVFALVEVKGKLSIWKNGSFYQDIAPKAGYNYTNTMYITTN
jgi:hypothetical protein